MIKRIGIALKSAGRATRRIALGLPLRFPIAGLPPIDSHFRFPTSGSLIATEPSGSGEIA